jgi:polar amino acid transport system substrate-binding protein
VALATLGALLAGCSSSGSDADVFRPPTSTTVPPPATTAAPQTDASSQCDNPTASYQPTGPLPAPQQMPPNTYMAEIAARGRLVVGVSADTKLFGARNPFTGQIEGFDIDILHEVARAIFGDPDKIEFRVITYAQRLPSIEDGSVDIVAHTMTINCVRWQRIAFSTEYYHAGQRILVRIDSGITDVSELGGHKVCAAKGSTNIEQIATKVPSAEIVGVDDLTDCLVLFQQGAVDAITGDDTVLAGFKAQDHYAQLVGQAFTDEPYGLGINLGHPEFVRFVNSVLEQLRANGEWAKIQQRWLAGIVELAAPPTPVYGRVP